MSFCSFELNFMIFNWDERLISTGEFFWEINKNHFPNFLPFNFSRKNTIFSTTKIYFSCKKSLHYGNKVYIALDIQCDAKLRGPWAESQSIAEQQQPVLRLQDFRSRWTRTRTDNSHMHVTQFRTCFPLNCTRRRARANPMHARTLQSLINVPTWVTVPIGTFSEKQLVYLLE